MPKFKLQVNKDHYFKFRYDHKRRWVHYWYQINQVFELQPKEVLEIGIGNGLVSNYLRTRQVRVTTLDIDENLKPDIVASVLNIPLKDNSFDLVLAAEVLEHLPFEDFTTALKEIKRVTKKYAVITLPDRRRTLIYLGLKIPFINQINVFIKVPSFKKHIFDGQHYWEIGKRGYSLDRIKKIIKKTDFKIINHFCPFDAPWNHYFILEK